MPQLFGPAANTIARASIVVFALLPLGVIVTGSQITRSPANTKVGIAKDQPVPFSHRHHTWELGIDCRYCHVGVEQVGYAGVPDAETCMTCHSQIWTNSPLLEVVRQSYETNTPIKWSLQERDGTEVGWNLINKVPEFVYFDHSIHIARGISCNNCHGPVQRMHMTYKGQAFTMAWCLECHRNPEKYLYEDPDNAKLPPEQQLSPRQQVFALYRKQQLDPELRNVTARERNILLGRGQQALTKAEIERGKQLVEKLGVKTRQLADCAICHH